MSDSSENPILTQILRAYKIDNASTNSTSQMYEILNDYVEEIVLNNYLYEELQAMITDLQGKVILSWLICRLEWFIVGR